VTSSSLPQGASEGRARKYVPDTSVDALAFYLGYSSWPRPVVDFGWSLDKAQAWRIIEAQG